MGLPNSYAYFMPVPAPLPIVSIKIGCNEHIIPRLLGAVFEHSLEIGTVVIRARHGTVDISVENKNVVAFRILIAHTDLPFDGLFCLPLAGIARIDDCCFHNIVASFGFEK